MSPFSVLMTINLLTFGVAENLSRTGTVGAGVPVQEQKGWLVIVTIEQQVPQTTKNQEKSAKHNVLLIPSAAKLRQQVPSGEPALRENREE